MSDKKHSARQRHGAAPTSLAHGVMRGLAVTLIAAAVLLPLFTAIVYSTADPGRLVSVAALAALYISCFAGSMTAASSCAGDAAAGLICGAVFWLILLLVSLAIPGGGSWLSVGTHSICLLFSAAGSLASFSIASKKRKSPHRRRAR